MAASESVSDCGQGWLFESSVSRPRSAIRRMSGPTDQCLVSAAGSRVSRAVVGPYNRSVTTSGVTPEYFAIRAWGVAAGRILNQTDERRASTVCLIGQTVADAL